MFPIFSSYIDDLPVFFHCKFCTKSSIQIRQALSRALLSPPYLFVWSSLCCDSLWWIYLSVSTGMFLQALWFRLPGRPGAIRYTDFNASLWIHEFLHRAKSLLLFQRNFLQASC